MKDHVMTADEFFEAHVHDGVYDFKGGGETLLRMELADYAAFYRLVTSWEFTDRCLRLLEENPEAFGIPSILPSARRPDDPDISREAWVRAVTNDDTDLGYEDWMDETLEAFDEEE